VPNHNLSKILSSNDSLLANNEVSNKSYHMNMRDDDNPVLVYLHAGSTVKWLIIKSAFIHKCNIHAETNTAVNQTHTK